MQVFLLMKTADGKAFTFIDENDVPYYIDCGDIFNDIVSGVYGKVAEYDPTNDFLNVVIREVDSDVPAQTGLPDNIDGQAPSKA